MKKIEIIDMTLETELGNFVYESDIIPKQNDLISIDNNTYIITEVIHKINAEIDVTLLAQPATIKYGDYIH